MKAKILKLAGDEGLATVVEIEGKPYEAMDCIGYDKTNVKSGEVIDIEFSIGLDDDDESWESIFSSNVDKSKKLVRLEGWSYKAYAEIISINPMVIDCGVAKFNDVIETNDLKCIGEFIAFNILRLDVWSND